MESRYSLIGHITKPHGIYGKLLARLDIPLIGVEKIDFIFIQMGHTLVPYQVKEASSLVEQKVWFLLSEVDNRNEAERLIKKTLWLPKEMVKNDIPTNQGAHLIGYYAVDIKEGELGVVKQVVVFKFNVCLVVDYKGKSLLIPYHDHLITNINKVKKIIELHLPTGFMAAMGFA